MDPVGKTRWHGDVVADFTGCQMPLSVKSWRRLPTFVSADRSNAPTIICNAPSLMNSPNPSKHQLDEEESGRRRNRAPQNKG